MQLTTQEERDARIAQFADAHFEDISDLARVLTEAEFGFFPELRIYLNLVNFSSTWPGILPQLRHPIPGVRMPQHFEPQMRVRPRNVWMDHHSNAADEHLEGFLAVQYETVGQMALALYNWGFGYFSTAELTE